MHVAWRNLQAQLRAAGMEDREFSEHHHDRARSGRCRQNACRPGGSAGHTRAAGTLIIGGLSNPAWKVEVEGIAVA